MATALLNVSAGLKEINRTLTKMFCGQQHQQQSDDSSRETNTIWPFGLISSRKTNPPARLDETRLLNITAAAIRRRKQ